MLYICKRKVKLYSIILHVKGEAGASPFCFRARLLFPKCLVPTLFVSFIFANCYLQCTSLLVAITSIGRCNSPNCSWLLKKLVIFSKTSRTFKTLFMFSKVGGILNRWQLFRKSRPGFSKNVVVAPQKLVVSGHRPQALIIYKSALDKNGLNGRFCPLYSSKRQAIK